MAFDKPDVKPETPKKEPEVVNSFQGVDTSTPSKPSVFSQPAKPEPVEFDLTEDTDTGKEVYAIYGQKGQGKTTLALSFPGSILALSFDGKTTIVKNNFFNKDARIKVFNALKYYKENPKEILMSSQETYNFIIAILDKIGKEDKPDYILFDCAEVMTVVCEMLMRHRNGVKPYAGIGNLNLWKERKALLGNIHKTALKYCNKGLIYTLYIKKDEIIKEGEVVMKKDIPQWTGIIMYETDFVLRTHIEYDKEKGKQCFVRVCSSKNDNKLKTGSVIDITGFKTPLFKEEP